MAWIVKKENETGTKILVVYLYAKKGFILARVYYSIKTMGQGIFNTIEQGN